MESLDTLTVGTPLGPITARGTTVFMALITIVFGGYIYMEMGRRSSEHDDMQDALSKQLDSVQEHILSELQYNGCLNRLTIYQHTLALKGEFIDFRNIPNDLVRCIPQWLEGKKQGGVK